MMVGEGAAGAKTPSPSPSPPQAGERGCYCADRIAEPVLSTEIASVYCVSLAMTGLLMRLY